MSRRNSRDAKAARREVRARGPVVNLGEVTADDAVAGCPMVPRDHDSLMAVVGRPDATLLPDEMLPPGVTAAVRWYCADGCGQDHVVILSLD
jgi:hypothetical protein